MKKVLALATLGTMALVSCKKDYTCDCSYSDETGTHTFYSAMNEYKKKDAKYTCDIFSVPITASELSESCTLNKK